MAGGGWSDGEVRRNWETTHRVAAIFTAVFFFLLLFVVVVVVSAPLWRSARGSARAAPLGSPLSLARDTSDAYTYRRRCTYVRMCAYARRDVYVGCVRTAHTRSGRRTGDPVVRACTTHARRLGAHTLSSSTPPSSLLSLRRRTTDDDHDHALFRHPSATASYEPDDARDLVAMLTVVSHVPFTDRITFLLLLHLVES